MAVITISREMGSGGAEIGRQVAQTLGYAFVDKNTIDGIFRQYGLTQFDDLYTTTPGFWDLFQQDNLLIISMLNETLEALAQRGQVVILGRGGFAILGHLADVLDVRIVAPAEVRAQRVMARENLATLPEAQARVAEDDHMRQRFVQLFYDRPWDDPTAFDLRIDTGAVSYDAAAQQIVDAARALDQKQFGSDAVTTAGLEVDPVLADAVTKVLAYPLAPLRS